MRCNRTAAEQKDEAELSGDSLHYEATHGHASAFEGVVSDETWSTAGFDAGNSAWNLTERVGLHSLGQLRILCYCIKCFFYTSIFSCQKVQ